MLAGNKKKEYQKQYMALKRSNKRSNKTGSNTDGSNKEYPPILHDLIDPERRKKLQAISLSLHNAGLEKMVTRGNYDFQEIGNLLASTE